MESLVQLTLKYNCYVTSASPREIVGRRSESGKTQEYLTMQFNPTLIDGAFLIEPTPIHDERGSFSRISCLAEYARNGINGRFVQCNLVSNRLNGTIRGLHFQSPPFAENKLVSVARGSIFDVALDLREDSPTFGQWFGAVLNHENRKMLYIPEGCAHGYQTLKPDTEVYYQSTQFYHPDFERGVRWDDPRFNITWPKQVTLVSEKDQSWEAV